MLLYRGAGAAARRYLEADRSRADEYYLDGGVARADLSVVDGSGRVTGERSLTPIQYAGWVDWGDPITGESMGTPRQAGEARQSSPRFAEMVVNSPKSLSIAAALHPEVSEALDAAQRDAVAEIRSWLGLHSVTRVGPRGWQEVVPVERLETVAISHRTSRAGDPHRHIHLQIGTRVWAAGAWRGLDTAALFRQQGAIRALGTAVLAAHPGLASVLDAHALTLDHVTGEVAELQPFNAAMSKRASQVARNLAMFEAQWAAANPGQEPGPVVSARLQAKAWNHERPHKKPSRLGSEAGWRRELDDAGYTPDLPRAPRRDPVVLDELRVQEIANRALDRCAAGASTWTVHGIQEHVTRIIAEAGVRAERGELRDVIAMTTRLAAEDCLSVLPPVIAHPEHVAHLTSVRVIAADTQLRDLLTARAAQPSGATPDVSSLARDRGLDDEQERAAAAVASSAPLVVVEGAAGAGKTTMLGVAIAAAEAEGRATRVVTPTKKAADVAARELGVPTDSVAKLVHAHGWRWDEDGVWTRLAVGEPDPRTGTIYAGPPAAARLHPGERVVVDEAGMLDQDTALALLEIADDARASLALVGDRAQLAAVGRGGVLDIAAQVSQRTFDMATVHRFADPEYADLTVQIRRGENLAVLFDRLEALGLVVLHPRIEDAHDAVARTARDGDAVTVATNDEARALNAAIREVRVRRGDVDDAHTTYGSDGLPIGAGDVVQTRLNNSELGVANRQTWTVQHVTDDGDVWARATAAGGAHGRSVRLPAPYVAEHTHLAYAATSYGAQGATTPGGHTILSDALDGAGLYVGMTRGRESDTLHVVAADRDEARAQLTAALQRDRADRGLTDATHAAHHAVSGLVADGPMALVNAERALLRAQITRAEHEAARWENALGALSRQGAQHRVEAEQQVHVVTAADARLADVRATVAAPLIEMANTDGADYLSAQERAWQAHRALSVAGRFGRRSAAHTAREAFATHRMAENSVRRRWGDVPHTTTHLPLWAEAAAERQAVADPRVVAAQQAVDRAHLEQRELKATHQEERSNLMDEVAGGHWPSRLAERVTDLRGHVRQARRELAEIDALPVGEAAQLIRDRAARAEAERIAEAARLARAAERSRSDFSGPVYPSAPDRDYGMGR
ncbi:MobF family relaxase [Cellulomonas sp. KRMCY2]|uniref:MobF family relaxase n=1 Tax=Cellulomonas sp. KRMCY2 TaxID=1304865 RepID=UPI0004B0FAEC|nr:MobF family relaxase [Cellulomonas sp. KRMCY2]